MRRGTRSGIVHPYLRRSAWLVALVVTFSAPALADATNYDRLLTQTWRQYEGRHFTVMTNLPQGGEAVVQELELFRRVVLRFVGLPAVPDRLPTLVVMFARQGEFARIVDRPNALGYTNTTLRHNRMVSAGGNIDVQRRHVMFHEYVHYVLRSATNAYHPSWYDEGLAEMLSTVYERRGEVRVGTAPPTHRSFLAGAPSQVSISGIVHNDDLSDWRPINVSLFYAVSWAMVRYIYGYNDGAHVASLDDYLRRVQQGDERVGAFEAAFGMTARAMARRARKHVERRDRPLVSYPRSEFSAIDVRAAVVMDRTDVALELAMLSVFSNTKLARRLLEQGLGAEPGNARLQGAIAVTHQAEQAYASGARIAREALALAERQGAVDVVLPIDLADLLMVWNGDTCQGEAQAERRAEHRDDHDVLPQDAPENCTARYREAQQAYERALEIDVDNPEAMSGLAWTLFHLGEDLPSARAHIGIALDYQPWSPTLQYRTGMILKRVGEAGEARAHLERALSWGEDGEVRENALEALAELE